jgi:hypothetical protein
MGVGVRLFAPGRRIRFDEGRHLQVCEVKRESRFERDADTVAE